MGRINIDYGIDLGTTNSALAVINNGVIEVKEYDRSRIVPSCVAYNRKGALRVGISALALDPHFIEFKRKMGIAWEDVKHPDVPENVNAEELSAEVLNKLRSGIIKEEQFKSVVITVPALFDMNQVAATRRAGELAGFDQVEILMEPVAAAFNYGMTKGVKNGKFVVFDFGGGTFDAALVKAEEGVMEVISTEGDIFLGGKDLDNAVVDNVLLPLLRENYNVEGLDKEGLNKLKKELKKIADKLKIDLGTEEEVDFLVDLEQLGEDASGVEIEIDQTFTREQIHGVMDSIFMKAIDHCKTLLKVNNVSIDDLKALVLVGGPTQIPRFRELIEQELTNPDLSLNPMTAIAEGAALYASTFKSSAKGHGAPIGGYGDEGNQVDAIELNLKYEAVTSRSEIPLGIKLESIDSDGYSCIIKSSVGSVWESAKVMLPDVATIPLKENKPNSFTISLYDREGNLIPCTPNSFSVIHGPDLGPGVPLAHHIGMEVIDGLKGKIFTPFKGLEKDGKIPVVGHTDRDLYNSSALRPGVAEDKMKIPIFLAQRDARGSRSIVNIYADTIEVNGMDVSKHVPEKSLVEFTMKINRSQVMTLEVEFPGLDMDVITKEMEFPTKTEAKREQIDTLISEIKKGIQKLDEAVSPVENLSDLKSRSHHFERELELITDDNYEQIFNNLRSFLLEIDIACDQQAWPTIKKELIDTLFDLEQIVSESVQKKLKGWEKDQSDLAHFTQQKDQLLNIPNPNHGNALKLIDNVKSAIFQIHQRHNGKQIYTAWIIDFNQSFNSIDWKNSSMARQEVNRGMQLVNSGAGEDELLSAVRSIVQQMRDPSTSPSGTVIVDDPEGK